MDSETQSNRQEIDPRTGVTRLFAWTFGYVFQAIAIFCILLPVDLGVAATIQDEGFAKNAPLFALVFSLLSPLGQMFRGPLFGDMARQIDRNHYEVWLRAKHAPLWKWMVVYLVSSGILTAIGLYARSGNGHPSLETVLGYSFGCPADVMFWYCLTWFIADKSRSEPQTDNPALPTV